MCVCGWVVQVLVWDEPSTGLDPAARRDIWRIVQVWKGGGSDAPCNGRGLASAVGSMASPAAAYARACTRLVTAVQSEKAAGRTLLITSHSMEEIDLLSTRIAIIHAGRLQAVGPQQRLKSVFGDGYKLTCTLDLQQGRPPSQPPVTVAEASAQLDVFVRRYVSPLALVTQRTDRAVGYLLPPSATPHGPPLDIARVFSLLMHRKAEAGVCEFGLSQATLEDVFVRVVEASERAGREL